MLRRGQLRPVIGLLGFEVEEPVLAGLEAADERMPAGLRVRGRVLRGRGVAAADVPALSAAAQVQPPAAGLLAFDAPGAARRHGRVDARHLGHPAPSSRGSGALPGSGSLSASGALPGSGATSGSEAVSGSHTRNRVSPGTDSTWMAPWCLFATIRQEMSSPSPVPSPTGLVVKNGSNIRSLISGGTPGPVSPNSATR